MISIARPLLRSAAPLLLAGCALLSACAAPPLTGCTLASRGTKLPEELRETSGAAFSRRSPGAWWSMNDSGNAPELIALDSAGRTVGAARVRGAENLDWEDMAAGPCAGGAGDCLYAADVGDNGAERPHVTLYRVPEPAPGDTITAAVERFRARYPDGPRDAEAFFVLPDGGAYVVTKGRRTPVELYRVSLDSAGIATMERVRVLAPTPDESSVRVTGAGASPDGRWIAIRTYVGLDLYRREELLGGGPPALKTSLESLRETQGEAVALAPGGRVLLTTERSDGRGPTVNHLSCPMP